MEPILSFPDYSITKSGQVWSHRNRIWLKLTKQAKGHLIVSLYNGQTHIHSVHRLVLETYIGPCPPDMECRHLDGNPANNKLNNLKWGTRSENSYDAIRHGTHTNFWVGICGEKHPCSKLCEGQVKVIFRAYHDGAHTQQELADAFYVSTSTIRQIIQSKTWGHLWC